MRKILFIICLLFCLIFCFISSVSFAYDSNLYLTSEGLSFSLDDVLMYDSDFYDKDFKSESEVIDFIYQTGYNRTSAIYDYNYDGNDSRVDVNGTNLQTLKLNYSLNIFIIFLNLKI